jgi:hypothetical protein
MAEMKGTIINLKMDRLIWDHLYAAALRLPADDVLDDLFRKLILN